MKVEECPLQKQYNKYNKLYKKKVGYISNLVFDLIFEGEKDIVFKLSSFSNGYTLKVGSFHSLKEESNCSNFPYSFGEIIGITETMLVHLLEERIAYVDNHIEILKNYTYRKLK